MQRWEYRRTFVRKDPQIRRWETNGEHFDEDALLEEWSAAGWELVSVVPEVTGIGAPSTGGICLGGLTEVQTCVHWLYFKRPLPD